MKKAFTYLLYFMALGWLGYGLTALPLWALRFIFATMMFILTVLVIITIENDEAKKS